LHTVSYVDDMAGMWLSADGEITIERDRLAGTTRVSFDTSMAPWGFPKVHAVGEFRLQGTIDLY